LPECRKKRTDRHSRITSVWYCGRKAVRHEPANNTVLIEPKQKRVRLDLILQQSELDSASRDDIVVVGSSVRSAQRIRSGEAFNHVLKESEDGEPMVWLEVRVQAVQGEAANKMATPPMFRGIEGPMPRP